MKCKTYSELIQIPTFDDRLKYAYIGGGIGEETFGYDRYLNQKLYNSHKWKQLRNDIIIRDNGCDLAAKGYDLYDRILIHHLNPITRDDILNRAECIFDPENLICVSFDTHNYIHYGLKGASDLGLSFERTPGDMCPWK